MSAMIHSLQYLLFISIVVVRLYFQILRKRTRDNNHSLQCSSDAITRKTKSLLLNSTADPSSSNGFLRGPYDYSADSGISGNPPTCVSLKSEQMAVLRLQSVHKKTVANYSDSDEEEEEEVPQERPDLQSRRFTLIHEAFKADTRIEKSRSLKSQYGSHEGKE